jgi:hypothetical protein
MTERVRVILQKWRESDYCKRTDKETNERWSSRSFSG